jgi:diacylglycerol kinase family enzyme
VARQLNLPVAGPLHPKPLLEAARMLLAGRVCPVDVGRVTLATGKRHHFLAWAGVGFDAEMSRSIAAVPARKKRLGPFAFALAGFLILRDFRGTPVRFRVDGHVINRRVLMLVANNIQLYGIIFRMAQHAVIDDGQLDIYGFLGDKPAQALLHAIRLLVNRHIDDPEVDIYRAQRMEIVGPRPMPVQTDGDFVGETPAVIESLPRAMRLVVPATAPVRLFSESAGQEEIKESAMDWMYRVARDVQNAIRPERY